MDHHLSPKRRAFLFVLGVWLGVYLAAAIVYRGPAPRGDDAPLDVFSAARAVSTLRRVLGSEKPHPVGSLENDAVRSRLIAELESFGMTPEIHETSYAEQPLKNVLARFPNSATDSKPLVVATHYDSCPAGPGAGDAGSAVAALLECARILVSEKLDRPVYLLFTDGEERGLWGAKQWVKEHQLAKVRPLVLNFDARGDRGASLLYETHENNRRFVAWMASRLPRPKATGSAFVTVYRQLPNGTDFSEFRRGGMTGANFAIIGGVQRYHTAQDTIANLDPRSVQHHGENALALTRALAAARDEDFEDNQDAVFFDVLGVTVIWYPVWLARLLSTATLLFFFGSLVVSGNVRKGREVAARIVVAIVAAALPVTAVGWALKEPASWALSTEPSAVAWMVAIIAYVWLTAICFSFGSSFWLLSKHSVKEIWWGVWLFWSFLGCLTAWFVPGISYFAAVPALLAVVTSRIQNVAWRATWSASGVAIVVVPALYLLPIALRVTAAATVGSFIVVALSSLMPFIGQMRDDSSARIDVT